PSGAYDASGNLGMDVVPSPSGTSNLYSYDAEDRICASQAGSVLTQYIYDAEGHRVAKGTVNAVYIYDPQTQTNKLSCNVSSNGFSETYAYVLGHSGEQMTEIKNGQWQHTNLDIAGGLLATYDVKGLHYQISDWLGSRRVQTDPTGAIEETCTNQPFGDNLQCVTPNGAPVTADDATEHHFTNKERDAESGLDFFGARYYSGGMGRFLNPDWSYKSEAVPYANVGNPQTLNLYAYVGNSPVGRADIDGHIYDGASESVGGSGCSEASACGHNSSIKSFSEIAAQNAAAAYKKVRIAEIFTQRKKETGQQWINRIASSVILSRSAPTSYNVAGYVGIKVDYTVAISGQSNSDILHPLFVTEHQSDHSAALTGHDGMSGGVLHNVFADDVGHRAYATSSSNQTFTVSLHEGINGVGRFGSGPSAPVRVMMNGEIGSGIHIEFNSKGVDETLIPLPTQH
ncbi:MAG TPA: RHS repeat-associated core domain-containing protein, partial [Acidobacteriaceae bacterium]